MTDKELIRKVHNGNKDALNSIVQKYYDEIYRFFKKDITNQMTDAVESRASIINDYVTSAEEYMTAFALSNEVHDFLTAFLPE